MPEACSKDSSAGQPYMFHAFGKVAYGISGPTVFKSDAQKKLKLWVYNQSEKLISLDTACELNIVALYTPAGVALTKEPSSSICAGGLPTPAFEVPPNSCLATPLLVTLRGASQAGDYIAIQDLGINTSEELSSAAINGHGLRIHIED